MKNAEFVALLIANTNKTRNLRTYGRKWFSGARRLNDCVLCNIGHVIALIQANINQGKIINKHEECLLVYNFQPLPWEESCNGVTALYLTLDMMIRPMEVINDTQTLDGKPIQLVVEAVSGEVMNNTKAMLQLGLIFPDELEGEVPESYGYFKNYTAICGFAVIAADPSSVQPYLLFSGSLDSSPLVQHCVAFDSIIEGRKYLESIGFSDGWIAELILPKEDLPTIIASGLSRYVLKLINLDTTLVSPREDCRMAEANVHDQVQNLCLAQSEPPTTHDEKVLHPDCLMYHHLKAQGVCSQ